MLDYAYFHQAKLQECLKKALKEEKLYFYFMSPSKFFSIPIERDDWNVIQFVSLNPCGDLIGFMAAYVDHRNNIVYNMDFINFYGKPTPIFSRDAKFFFDELFVVRKFRKIIFKSISINPAVSMYRKLVKRWGGKEVGVMKENRLLTDGNYYDESIFELYRENYINATAK